VDIGLGPRQLAARLKAVGASWPNVQAVLLTHTHSDHWNDRTLAYLQRLRIPLYCHPDHQLALRAESPAFVGLKAAGLVHTYEPGASFGLTSGLSFRPFRLRHDGGATCGFRFEGDLGLLGQPGALAYATDLGSWPQELPPLLADVDVLALEFNHDVVLERASGRSPRLIARVLGDHGHLSNVQAAALLRQVLNLSEPGRLRHLVQMHLSQDCNRPELAVRALGELPPHIQVHTASQHEPGPRLTVGPCDDPLPPRRRARRSPQPRSGAANGFSQPLLPGWEEGWREECG
jgi:phosphoribosyl 1,2-cyclic phosphodiesterase